MSAEYLVRYCSPTLAGIKIGSLFSCRYEDVMDLLDFVETQERLLAPKGVHMVLVKMCNGFALIYVYRLQQLEQLLADPRIQSFLRRYGYSRFDTESCLALLKKRLLDDDFPHEVGIFLGYPLEDVQAFIVNKGANCPCVGTWKAYTNLAEAQRIFRSYQKCTQIYCQRFWEGVDIARLTVAG